MNRLLPSKPNLADLTGVRVHTSLPAAGAFECSNDLLNRAHAMILRTYLSNLHSIPTDCPQREKMGWMCDGMVASEQAMVNFDARTLSEKWAADMADAQSPDGSEPAIVPAQGWSQTGHPGDDFQCPWWGGATVVVPWNLYQTYGDVRILAEHYGAMRRYVDSMNGVAQVCVLRRPGKAPAGQLPEQGFHAANDRVDFLSNLDGLRWRQGAVGKPSWLEGKAESSCSSVTMMVMAQPARKSQWELLLIYPHRRRAAAGMTDLSYLIPHGAVPVVGGGINGERGRGRGRIVLLVVARRERVIDVLRMRITSGRSGAVVGEGEVAEIWVGLVVGDENGAVDGV